MSERDGVYLTVVTTRRMAQRGKVEVSRNYEGRSPGQFGTVKRNPGIPYKLNYIDLSSPGQHILRPQPCVAS